MLTTQKTGAAVENLRTAHDASAALPGVPAGAKAAALESAAVGLLAAWDEDADRQRITDENNAHAIGNARGQFETLENLGELWRLIEEYDDYETAAEDDEDDAARWRELCELESFDDHETVSDEDVRERVNETGLSITWKAERSGHSDGTGWELCGFEWLLSTGGPACRVVADCDEHGTATSAVIQWQDCGTPWTTLYDCQFGDDELRLLSWFGEIGAESG